MYENIVVGFDNSEYSKAAVIEASNFVKRHGGKFALAHAVYFNEEEFGLAPEKVDERFDFGTTVCNQAKNMVASEFGIDVDVLVRLGEPHEVLTDIAREQNADLIAMGTNSRKGLKRLFMGSVTSTVIGKSPCDVLMVKKPSTECTGTYSSILVPFDGSEDSRNALKKAAGISKANGCNITVLYVITRTKEIAGRLKNFFNADSIQKNLRLEAEKILQMAQEIAADAEVSIEVEIREGASDEQIVKAAYSLKSDLVVMGRYGHWRFDKTIIGSTTKRVMMNAPCPVLAVAVAAKRSWEAEGRKASRRLLSPYSQSLGASAEA